jgi:hypothetical protein
MPAQTFSTEATDSLVNNAAVNMPSALERIHSYKYSNLKKLEKISTP